MDNKKMRCQMIQITWICFLSLQIFCPAIIPGCVVFLDKTYRALMRKAAFLIIKDL